MAKISRTRVTASDEAEGLSEEHPETFEGSNEAPAPRVTRTAVSSGWGAKQEERTETVKAPVLKLKDNGTRVIKVLDAAPPVKYKRHYVNSKNRYYTCTQNQCPLCQAGVRASWTFVMNVVDLIDDPSEVKTWTFGTEVSSQLQDIAENKAELDATNTYFEVRHVKVAGRSAPSTSVSYLRARDLMDDHSLEPLNEDEILELNEDRYGAEVVYINTADYLEDVASEVLPGDLPQKRK